VSYRNFLDELKKGLPSPAYLLVSSDPFLHAEAVSSIVNLIPAKERDFSFYTFDLLNTGVIPFDQILDVLNTLPFFAGRKVVAIENSQKLLKKDLQKLGRYLQNPAETSVLVLLNAGTAKKEMKDAVKGAKQIVLDISERDIPAWVKNRAGAKGIEMSAEALDFLIGTVGTDLGLLSSEIDKCTLMGKPDISKEDMAEIIESKRTYNAFALVDAIGAKDVELAFRIYKVLQETEEPYNLLGALNWQFGRSVAGAASRAGRDYDYNVFDALQKADVGIKTGSCYPLELLLVRLLGMSRPPSPKGNF
jgi:DNA polymerase-3 subunit delta